MAAAPTFISTDALLLHWQGHRRLTRRTIDAFPEDQLFAFTIGGMRPFGALARELLSIAVPMVQGVVTDKWETSFNGDAMPKAEILKQWDEATEALNKLWPQVPPERFAETMTAFGQYKDVLHNLILYAIDNEVHHRGQGTVYLRALGIEPPAFYDRS
jgi:uncharacterized damage-inducible protein DinB